MPSRVSSLRCSEDRAVRMTKNNKKLQLDGMYLHFSRLLGENPHCGILRYCNQIPNFACSFISCVFVHWTSWAFFPALFRSFCAVQCQEQVAGCLTRGPRTLSPLCPQRQCSGLERCVGIKGTALDWCRSHLADRTFSVLLLKLPLDMGSPRAQSLAPFCSLSICAHVKFDSDFRFERQISGVVQKSFHQLRQIAKAKPILSRPDREKCIHAFIPTRLHYCIICRD